ncbi:hypothetical protein TWF192_007451 [Orbilia oligospora]|uniref:Uncharacterized protein n=1 Tax=Orbilia oligospora TaxID=2813651 RepID=A0A6G1M663_ORBOL|nr:hypothetical protein TWF191_009371 [Orbilia oligospora]KAF3245249.1 hypothetical protein TWF192_007451 [Orbilia oligospora]
MTTQTYLRRNNTMPTSLRLGTRHQSTILQDANHSGPMPWPEPFQFSIPFSTKHLDGYFFTYQPRINTSTAEKETEVILRVHQEWFDRGGCQVRDGALSVDGGPVLSVVFPEAEPRRLLNLAAIVSIGYIQDDWASQEIVCNRSNHGDKESNMKKFGAIINQMKSKAITEMLENDSSLISVTQIFGARETRSLESQDLHLGEFQGLDHYLEEKYLTDTWSRLPSILPYVYDIKLSKDQLARYSDLIRLTAKMNTLIKDISSAERDWSSHISHNKLGVPVSAVYIMMQTQDVTIAQAKKLVERKCLELEQQFLRLSWELLDNTEHMIQEEAARYISALHYLVAGELSWHAGSNRYRIEPSDPFYPKPEYKLNDFPQDTRGLANSVQAEWSGYMARAVRKIIRRGIITVLKPFEYLLSLQTKKISSQAIQALDFWYNLPRRSLDIISSIVDMLHSSSSILDDIEGTPLTKQGAPSAPMVFGTPRAVNTANYLFVKCLQEVQKLPHSLSAVEIFTDEMANINLGRGYNTQWTFRSATPLERDYIKMVDGKTGSLFRLAARLMKAEATQNKDLNVDGLVTLMSRYFQIRDDHQSLSSMAPGDPSGLDEGKYSLALIHSLNNSNPNDREQLESLLLLRTRQGKLFPEQKSLVMKIFARTGSMGYTVGVMERLENEIERRLESLEGTIIGAERNWTMRAIMEYLRVGRS